MKKPAPGLDAGCRILAGFRIGFRDPPFGSANALKCGGYFQCRGRLLAWLASLASPFSGLALGICRATATSGCSLGEGPEISTTYRCPEKFRCPFRLPFRSPKPCSVTSSSGAARRACGESRINDHVYYMLCADLSTAQNVALACYRCASLASLPRRRVTAKAPSAAPLVRLPRMNMLAAASLTPRPASGPMRRIVIFYMLRRTVSRAQYNVSQAAVARLGRSRHAARGASPGSLGYVASPQIHAVNATFC